MHIIEELFLPQYYFTFLCEAENEEQLYELIDKLMIKRKYKNIGAHIYEKGNFLFRLLLGAFYKYNKVAFSIEKADSEGQFNVYCLKQSKGVSGGAIGMKQVNNEMIQIKKSFQDMLQ